MKPKKIHPYIFISGGHKICSIEEFAQMEVPRIAPNEHNVFIKSTMVNIPVKSGYALLIEIARDLDGRYYIGCEYATPTGGGSSGASISRLSYRTQEKSFLGGLEYATRFANIKELDGYIAAAKREFFKHHHKQLSLFD